MSNVSQPCQQNYQPPQKSSSKKWWIIGGVGCLGSILACGGIFAALGVFGLSVIKNNPDYLDARAKVELSPAVQELVGSPIDIGKAGLPVADSANPQAISLVSDISGPDGKGTMTWSGTQQGQNFATVRLDVTVDGQTIDLLDEPDLGIDIDLGGE